ncbi:MAG: tetratricopeptide repeat protein [Treponema sp.]|nr:tetratricopeptide repeat protein [Treponema sp.]
MDYFLLVLNGFSAYQLAVAQINNSDTQIYIDECIWSLRKALLCKEGSQGDSRIYYVLGKAYYYKGASYADLSVTYLEAARRGGYEAQDIPEYLGLAYASVHDYRNSVAAFSLALDAGAESGAELVPAADSSNPLEIISTRNTSYTEGELPSDLLLLSIARSYTALDEYDAARAYLVRCLEISKDSNTRVATRLLLGEILAKAGNSSAAESQYLTILEENGDYADAHYQLGELYAAEGDKYKARAELRRALRVNPAHGPAQTLLTRLNM